MTMNTSRASVTQLLVSEITKTAGSYGIVHGPVKVFRKAILPSAEGLSIYAFHVDKNPVNHLQRNKPVLADLTRFATTTSSPIIGGQLIVQTKTQGDVWAKQLLVKLKSTIEEFLGTNQVEINGLSIVKRGSGNLLVTAEVLPWNQDFLVKWEVFDQLTANVVSKSIIHPKLAPVQAYLFCPFKCCKEVYASLLVDYKRRIIFVNNDNRNDMEKAQVSIICKGDNSCEIRVRAGITFPVPVASADLIDGALNAVFQKLQK